MTYITEITDMELCWNTDDVDTAEIRAIVDALEWQEVFMTTDDGVMDVRDGAFDSEIYDDIDDLMKALAKAGVYGIITLSGEAPYNFERYELDGREAVHKFGHVIWEDE